MPAVPDDFVTVLESLKGHEFRPEIHVSQIPPPSGIAPWSVALQAEINTSPSLDPDGYVGDSRFVVLYDAAEQPAWNGPLRIVTFTHAPVESDMAADPLIGEVAWFWLREALGAAGAQHHSINGTVTRNYNETFAGEAIVGQQVDVEIRASWSPTHPHVAAHLQGWADFVSRICGLDPVGIASLDRKRYV